MLLTMSSLFRLTTAAFSRSQKSDEFSRNYCRRYIVSGMYGCCTIGSCYWSSQGYQNCPVVRDDIVCPASESSEPAPASKHSGDKRKVEQPGECASCEPGETASKINASMTFLPANRLVLSHIGHQPEDNGTEVVDLLHELNDLMELQKRISSKVDDVVSRLKQFTQRSLLKGGNHVRWADSATANNFDDDKHRPRKRARGSL